jgi:hypothetical protein
MKMERVLPALPVTPAAIGLEYNGGLAKLYVSADGLHRNMATPSLLCFKAGSGHLFPGIFPGLFIRKDLNEKAPTQNVYSIKSVSLLSKPPGSQLLKTGGLSE